MGCSRIDDEENDTPYIPYVRLITFQPGDGEKFFFFFPLAYRWFEGHFLSTKVGIMGCFFFHYGAGVWFGGLRGYIFEWRIHFSC